MERRRQKAEALQAAVAVIVDKVVPERGDEKEVPKETPVTSPLREVKNQEEPPLIDPRKRVRMDDDVVKTYTPEWGVLSTDGVVSSVPPTTHEVGPDIYRGLDLPADRSLYDKVGTVDACTELMVLISMVRFSSFTFHLYFFIVFNLPWFYFRLRLGTP